MPSPFRLFRAGSPIALGNGLPRWAARRQIADIVSAVDGPPASGGGPDQAEEFFNTLRNFQKRRNLKVDGIVNPGGPTEGTLNAFAVAKEEGGPGMVKVIRPALDDLTRQGLTFTADPRNPDALGMWRDANGHRVDPEQAGQMLAGKNLGASDLDGKQILLAQRMFGKAGSDKIMTGDVPASSEVSAPRRETSIDPFEGVDSPSRGGRFTSGMLRRTADRIANDTETSRRVRDGQRKQERASRKPHRDIEKIEWETSARTIKPTTKFAAKIKDAVRIDYDSDAIGLDGAHIEVDWSPLNARGNVIPEFRRPGKRKQNAGGLILANPFGDGASTVLVSPYPNPNGFRVEIRIPKQPSINQNSSGMKFKVFVPKGEFVSQEEVR